MTCREIPAPTPIFESMEECEATLPGTLSAARKLEKNVLGQCVFVDPAKPEEDAQLTWNVSPEGKLFAEITFGSPTVASLE